MKRRDACRQLAALSFGIAAPVGLFGCSKGLDCSSAPGLSADELRTRNETAKYVEQTPDATKRCSDCALYVAAAADQCGGCKVIKGPIHPNGYCNLYVAKPPS